MYSIQIIREEWRAGEKIPEERDILLKKKGMRFAVAVALEADPKDPVLLRGDILESAKCAQEIGYDAIEIHVKDINQIDVGNLENFCSRNGFAVSALATGLAKRIDGLSFIDDDANVRKDAVHRASEFLEAAARFGAGVIIGNIRGSIPDLSKKDLYEGRFLESMTTLASRAEALKADLLLEVINRYENNYLNTVEESLGYLELIGSSRVKLHLDTFHMNIEETNMSKAIKACGENLGYIHLADNTRLAVGTGSIDFQSVIAAAQAAGYEGYLSLECLAVPDGETAARNSIAALNLIYPRD